MAMSVEACNCPLPSSKLLVSLGAQQHEVLLGSMSLFYFHHHFGVEHVLLGRSDEGRVGREGGSTCIVGVVGG